VPLGKRHLLVIRFVEQLAVCAVAELREDSDDFGRVMRCKRLAREERLPICNVRSDHRAPACRLERAEARNLERICPTAHCGPTRTARQRNDPVRDLTFSPGRRDNSPHVAAEYKSGPNVEKAMASV
jgi:hypothetical protein